MAASDAAGSVVLDTVASGMAASGAAAVNVVTWGAAAAAALSVSGSVVLDAAAGGTGGSGISRLWPEVIPEPSISKSPAVNGDEYGIDESPAAPAICTALAALASCTSFDASASAEMLESTEALAVPCAAPCAAPWGTPAPVAPTPDLPAGGFSPSTRYQSSSLCVSLPRASTFTESSVPS